MPPTARTTALSHVGSVYHYAFVLTNHPGSWCAERTVTALRKLDKPGNSPYDEPCRTLGRPRALRTRMPLAPWLSPEEASNLEPPRPKREPLVLVASAVAGGVAICAWNVGTPRLWMAFLLTALVVSWRFRSRPHVATFGLLVAIAAGSALAVCHSVQPSSATDIRLFTSATPRPAALEGYLRGAVSIRIRSGEPWSRGRLRRSAQFLLNVRRVRLGRRWQQASGRVQVTVDLPGRTHFDAASLAGARLRIYGQLARFGAARNPGNPSSKSYWEARGVGARCDVSTPRAVQCIGSAPSWSVACWLTAWREHTRAAIGRYVRGEQQGLALAMILGDRGQLPDEDVRRFRANGTAHFLAVSGMHVAVALAGWWWLVRSLPRLRRHAWWCTLILAGLYAEFTGGQPPAWRAALGVSAWWLARGLGRPVARRQLLAVVALLLFVRRPASWTEPGVQLSLAAVAAILWWLDTQPPFRSPSPLERLLDESTPLWKKIPRSVVSHFCHSLGMSLAVTMVLVPLVWHYFQQIPIAGILLTPLLAILMAVALWSGLVLSLFSTSAIGTLPAAIAGGCCSEALRWSQECNRIASSWLAPVSGPAPSEAFCLVFYSMFAILWTWQGQAFSLRRGAALTGAYLLAGWSFVARTAPVDFECVFFSVGHGTCVWVHTPDGRDWLYDAGTMGDPRVTSVHIARSLRWLGVRRLDGVVLTHADADHYNLLPSLVREIPIGQVLLPPPMLRRLARGQPDWFDSLVARGVEWSATAEGDRFDFGSVQLEVWHPPAEGGDGADNESSCVVALKYGDGWMVLPGDIEGRGLERLWSKYAVGRRVPLGVLMAPHHGSRHSRPDQWHRRYRIGHVVISGSRRHAQATCRRWDRPETVVWHTAHGAVRVHRSGVGWVVEQWDGREWIRSPFGGEDAIEGFPQEDAGAVESAADGADLDVEDLGDRAIVELFDLTQDEHGSKRRVEGREGLSDLSHRLAPLEVPAGVFHGIVSHNLLADQLAFPLLALPPIEGSVERDPVEPRIEGGLAREGRELGQRLEEGLLDRILGIRLVVQQVDHACVEPILVAAHEGAEGVGVALQRPVDQFPLVVQAAVLSVRLRSIPPGSPQKSPLLSWNGGAKLSNTGVAKRLQTATLNDLSFPAIQRERAGDRPGAWGDPFRDARICL